VSLHTGLIHSVAACVNFAGFFLFAALAVYFFYHPPTPLAVTAEHLEGLMHDAQHQLQHLGLTDNLQALSSSLSHKVHVFEDKLSYAFSGNLHQLHGNLQQIQGNLQHMQGNLHSNLKLVGSRLSDNLHQLQDTLQDSLHNVELSLHSKAATLSSNLHTALQQQLKPILQWPSPRWPVYVYFGGACVCLLTSSVCHLLGCCQKHIAEMVWRFDYAGIAVLIVTSFVPAMYYAFLCEPFWRNFYLLTTTSMGRLTGLGAAVLWERHIFAFELPSVSGPCHTCLQPDSSGAALIIMPMHVHA
jgi:adiponectin receptor